MSSAWMEVFKPEIDKKINAALTEERKKADAALSEAITKEREKAKAAVAEEHQKAVNMLFEYVQDGDMALSRASKRAGVSPENFLSEMEKRGYRLPELV